ncbi:glycosyltransferase [Rhodococcus sp. WS3]|uniref:glycosyltransferase n=1 Tax=Rhodococcus sp. WS3 TaxID=2486271 RepID=UPI0016515F16|nr:glycosyltransferase [Rhodococcus sp. WS3]
MSLRQLPDPIGRSGTILVASTGGHLAQLVRLRPRLDIQNDPLWITFDHPQSRSLLENERVTYAPYIAPRDFKGLIKAIPSVFRALKGERCTTVISTGAAIALVALPLARLLGRESIYIESVSRFDGPSLSGKILARIPGIQTYTQHAGWASSKWKYKMSVLEDYSVSKKSTSPRSGSLKVFVTLGTIKPYRFDRLVDALANTIPGNCEVTWQLGVTTRTDLRGTVHDTISATEFNELVRESDIVISHAGVGSAMQILDLGRSPILVPRRAVSGEHVDDHQLQIARELSSRGLARNIDADEITWEELVAASTVVIEGRSQDSSSRSEETAR